MIYGGNRMVFSSENFLSFMQSRRPRPHEIKQGILFLEFKTRCEHSKALLFTSDRRRPCKRRVSRLNMFNKTKLSINMPSDPFFQNEFDLLLWDIVRTYLYSFVKKKTHLINDVEFRQNVFARIPSHNMTFHVDFKSVLVTC